jgi:hypothetical protein
VRSPLYMNVDLLKNMADYYDIPVPEDAQVTRKTTDQHNRNLAIEKVIKAGGGSSGTAELTEVYETRLRPVRLLNDVIDNLLREDQVTDLTQDPESEILHRRPLLFEGEIKLSGAAKLATFIGPMIVQMLNQVRSGAEGFELDKAEFLGKFTSTDPSSEPQVLIAQVDERDEKFVMIVQPDYIIGNERSVEDVLGEQFIFGLVEKIVPPGRSYSLERYLLPGMNRNIRRMIPDGKMDELLEKLPEEIAGTVGKDDVEIPGPLFVINVAVIYS